jgi:hypothetical protein
MNRENEKAMFAGKKKSKLKFDTNIRTLSKNEDTRNLIGYTDEKDRRKMVKSTILNALKNGEQVTWNSGKPTETTMFVNKEYSNYDPKMSRHINYETHTVTGLGNNRKVIIHNKKTRLNPSFNDRPECPQCFKKKTKLYNTTNVQGKKVNVCTSCKKNIKIAKEFLKNYKGNE